ncbi:MAG: shikimate dehydrogenase [Polaribacter sp.]|jgi:shikimate dehydrogenase
MPQFGLIGYPLSHSFSGTYFAKKFQKEKRTDYRYDLFPLSSIVELPDLLAEHKDLVGLNVTIPYKEQILPYLDGISERAKAIGAVNTLSIRNGKIYGDNTDVYGFEISLMNLLDKELCKGALILGTGGAAKAVQYVLRKKNIPYQRISRKEGKGDLTYKDIDQKLLAQFPLLVNTTPLGMHPNINEAPDLPFSELKSTNKLFDLIYNPEKTLFLKYGMAKGCRTMNGLEMLVLQAEKSWEIWGANK